MVTVTVGLRDLDNSGGVRRYEASGGGGDNKPDKTFGADSHTWRVRSSTDPWARPGGARLEWRCDLLPQLLRVMTAITFPAIWRLVGF